MGYGLLVGQGLLFYLLRDPFRGLSSRKPELLIARTQGRDQFRHFLVTFQATEALARPAGGAAAVKFQQSVRHRPVAR